MTVNEQLAKVVTALAATVVAARGYVTLTFISE